MTRGSAVYAGSRPDCLPYFEGLGHPLPAFVNPAEHLIDLAAIDNRTPELEAASLRRVNALKAAWLKQSSQRSLDDPTTAPSSQNASKIHLSLARQIRVLTARSFKVACRDPLGISGSLVEAISMSVLTGWIFFGLDGSQSGIRSREGALFTAAALQGYLILLFETYRLTIDIELFDRERGEGVVGVLGFLASRRVARVFIEDIPVPLLFSIIFYFMIGFRPVATQFFTFFAIVLLGQYIAVSLAMLCVAISRNFAGASLAANIAYTLQSLAGGFYVQASTLPVYVRWLRWIAYVVSLSGSTANKPNVDSTMLSVLFVPTSSPISSTTARRLVEWPTRRASSIPERTSWIL